MESKITIREAVTENDQRVFWEQLRAYFVRDLFPDPADEDRAYFLGTEYRAAMEDLHRRTQDPCYWVFFCRDGQDIGFALPVLYTAEDGRCFIMEFCVYPQFRGGGTGKACAAALLAWAEERGGTYAELNAGDEGRARFWQSVGFVGNGADEWGVPLMVLPPAEELPITVELLSDPENWQLMKLRNGFLAAIGEEAMTEERQDRLRRAVRDREITFFVARRKSRAVGMCSVSRCFSTFACGDVGVFDDFFVEPVFRKRGIARKLASAAQAWCRENGISRLTVCRAHCDEGMYQSLGFDTPGVPWAWRS